ncbi:MAG: PHP domain-containing protein, partial [Clostridia bacterium]|nr:PHP domain-containing protein [Clostridia bacterium]
MTVSKSSGSIEAVVAFKNVIKCHDLLSVSKKICKTAGLERVDISPVFPAEKFDKNAVFAVLEYIKNKVPAVNGTFLGCDVIIEDGTVRFGLKNGGVSMLKMLDFENVFCGFVRDMFGLDITVELGGVTRVNAVDYSYHSEFYTEQDTGEENIYEDIPLPDDDFAPPPEENIPFDISPEILAEEPKKKKSPQTKKIVKKDKGDLPFDPESVKPLLGSVPKGKLTRLSDLTPETTKATVWGEIFEIDSKPTKDGKSFIVMVSITDKTNSTAVKFFLPKKQEEVLDVLKKGTCILTEGTYSNDRFYGDYTFLVRSIATVKKRKPKDDAPVKRVELHLHTNMSMMDGMNDAADLIGRAADWGHRAVAITDHGVLQSYPAAMNAAADLAKKGVNIKIIYGVEAYFVNDDGGESYKDLKSYHMIILVKNMTGLKNLYKLVSKAHLDYYYKRPRTPKSELIKLREGLIIGSACEAGELYRAILEGESFERLCKIAEFYDFLEIQPNGNNAFLVRSGKVADEEGLNNINRKIIELADTLGKPVVATGDVHFL